MKIEGIKPGSTASRSSLQVGDRLLAVNGRAVGDFLDLYVHLGEQFLSLEVERETRGGRRVLTVPLERRYGEEVGLEFPAPALRTCGNRCPFCFVDQNPAGLRQPLYVRDDDYRFSFLEGHFVTLTNLKETDFQRIIEYHLSPLYVSVHALDPDVRTRLLGTARAQQIRPQLDRLIRGGITLHTQVVILPGVNDGAVLRETVRGLFRYHPGVCSVGVVPVGLTAHMPAERNLRTCSPAEARAVCAEVQRMNRGYRRKTGRGFVYLADEFLLLAGFPIPATPHYDGFPQVENGVGMVRRTLNDIRRRRPAAARLAARGIRRVAALSGRSATPILARELARKFPAGGPVRVEVLETPNATFGPPVTVTGLLGGGDFARRLEAAGPFDLALIPPNAVNDEGLFLDDLEFRELAARFDGRVVPGLGPLWEA